MPREVKKTEYTEVKNRDQTGGFFAFIKDFLTSFKRHVLRRRAQRRVQKMLKNNFVKTQKAQTVNIKPLMVSTRMSGNMGLIPRAYRGVAAIFAVSFLILTILTSQYYGPQFIEAEIRVQNFTKNETIVNEGFDLLKYETRSEDGADEKAEFDAGIYTNGNFEAGEDDLVAVDAADDYLTLGSYGDNIPDTSQNDWWTGEQIQTCSAATFQAGTFTDTQWDTPNEWAELTSTGLTNGTGEYESEVIDAGTSVSWTDMTWTSTRPTYKELPANLGIESNYSAGNVDMTNNLLTMHFNESSDPIVDDSGVTGNGSYNGVLWNQSGQLGDALGFDGVDDLVDLGQDLSLILGDTGSVAFWMNTTQAGSDVPWDAPGITGSEQAGTADDVFWGYITAGGYIAVQAGNTFAAQSTTVVNDGDWHHVVLTRDSITGEMQVYVDGFLEDSGISETGHKAQYFDGIGRIYDDSGSHGWYQGLLDEVSFWSDVMTPTEVYDHYRRGANRIKFQVRSCDDAACSGESYIGPDGTGATYYTELMNDTVNLPSVALASVPDNQYLQWRAEFETDNSTMSPELLCVTFNNGANRTWPYRRCFDVDHTAAGAQNETEYQIYFDLDTESLVSAGKMQADGGDIRFLDSDENILYHYVADDMNTLSTRIWLEMDNIDAGTTEEVCMYYGNTGASDVSTREEVFTYQNQEDIYYVVQEPANGKTTEFVSYSDGNDISVDTYANTLDQYDADTHAFPSPPVATFSQATAIGTTRPINGGYNTNGTDNLVPSSFAGTQFAYRMDRYTNEFSFVSPWCSANVEVRNGTNAIVTGGSFTVAQGGQYNLTTTDAAGTGLPNDDMVIVEVTNSCPILATHHSTAAQDSFAMIPTAYEWYGVGSGNLEIAAIQNATTVTLYRSDNTTATYNLDRGQHVYISDAGSQGSEPAHRVVANNPIGVKAIADGDGTEAVTFMSVESMGFRHYLPEDAEYIAVATKAGVNTTVDLYDDGTQCGVGTPTATFTVTPTGNYPGKVLFGATPTGACIIADNPLSVYYENATYNDEHNLWSEVQNRQFQYGVSTALGTEELGYWSIDGTNTWTRRTPVTVTNTSSTTLTEYQVRVNLPTNMSYIFNRAQANGGDIRVAGATGDGTDNITYALEGYNKTNTTGNLWVKMPSIPAGGSATFYVYYFIGIDLGTYNPILWLDAADTATITQTAGSVSQWNDKSGNANHVSQTNAGAQPTLTTDMGNQVVSFSGDYMTDGSGIWANGTTYTDTYVFEIYRNLVLPENGTLFSERIQAGTYEGQAPNGTNVEYQANRNNQGRLIGTYGGDTTTYHVMRFEAHAGGNRIVARDGSAIASDAGGQSFNGRGQSFFLGSQAGGGQPQSINLGEILVFNGNLTATQVSQIENYLQAKWATGPTSTLTTTGDYDAIFRTTAQKENYYIVDSLSVSQTLSVISFADGNNINDSVNSQIVDEGQIITLPIVLPGSGQAEVYSVKGPIHAGFDSDFTDSAVPIAYAGTEFVYHVERGSDAFSFYAPFADANVQIQESSASGWTTLQTVTVTQGTTENVTQDIDNTSAFKIISDEPILGFHYASDNDSKILYPTHLALEEDSGNYELYGIGSDNLLLAAASDANVTIYRSDGTSSNIVLDATNNFTYDEVSPGVQGTSVAFHIVSDAPIGANNRGDADGIETAVFVSQKEFSHEYILSNSAQYLGIVARDPSVTCRVFDETGVEVTTDSTGTMDNIPPQTGGSQTDPYPNNIHIGGADTSDGAYFDAGYSMQCTEPVYAYYEHHVDTNSAITDETSWLTWPQVRKRAYVEPVAEDIDSADEQGFYYESGKDSATTGNDFEAYAEYMFDTNALVYSEHTYWRDITWEEIVNSRSATNGVTQVSVEAAYADAAPSCAAATYSAFTQLTPTTLSTSTDSSLPYVDYTTNTKQAILSDAFSDHECVKVRIYLRTGDQVYAPRITVFDVGYYVPTILEDQLNAPSVTVVGATSGTSERYRVLKAVTNDPGLNGSQAFTTFNGVSNGAVFTQADLDLFEIPSQTTNAQFAFPPFPGTVPVDAATSSPVDASNDLAVYFTHERSTGALETLDYMFNVDLTGSGGPQLTRDFQLEVSGL